MTAAPAGLPLLRTLVPALRGLSKTLTTWLDQPRHVPISTLTKAALEGIRDDLARKADDLDFDSPFLVIVLMGGTGVGKSSLLNALAGAAVAQASFTRPTTRDPIVYHHQSLKPERLDPALRSCRLVAHDREELRDKVLVDTPDLDSNEEANRERLMGVLPVADVVLYVGSQEKYHDRLGWELFQSQRQRRAFAFVLNKWDRCSQPVHGGMMPDLDLLRDLTAEGFKSPLLFRTAAQIWIDRANGQPDTPLPPGEQFRELVTWLEEGLSRLEIEALKARGVGQLLDDLERTFDAAKPADVSAAAAATRPVWDELLDAESDEFAETLLLSLEPRQRDIEHHFRITGQQRFQHLMAGYLGLLTRLQYAGSKLANPASGLLGGSSDAPRGWDIPSLTRECLTSAGKRGLSQRIQALDNRLIVAANAKGLPGDLVQPRLQELSALDWRGQFESALNESLTVVERGWTHPSGAKRLLRGALILLANYVPEITFVGSVCVLLWNSIVKGYPTSLSSVFVPFVLTLAVLMLFHVLIHLLLPLRWPAIRGDFRRYVRVAVRDRLISAYSPVPERVAGEVAKERATIDAMTSQVREMQALLNARRQTARIDSLYGTPAD
ncbi:MAG: GTPase [Gemmataceae bacterium]